MQQCYTMKRCAFKIIHINIINGQLLFWITNVVVMKINHLAKMIFLDLSSLANFNNFSTNGLTDMWLPWPTHLIPW